MNGNSFIAKVWEGSPANLREMARVENRNAVVSPIFGFSFDISPVVNERTAVTNVLTQYVPQLHSGTVDVATVLPRMLADLDAAGAERVIAEQQRQLDAWRATRR